MIRYAAVSGGFAVHLTTGISAWSLRSLAALLLLSLLNASCSGGVDAADRAALEEEVLEWREKRRASLMSPTGFLNLAGLFWLDEETADLMAERGAFYICQHDNPANPEAHLETTAGPPPVEGAHRADGLNQPREHRRPPAGRRAAGLVRCRSAAPPEGRLGGRDGRAVAPHAQRAGGDVPVR